MWFLWCFQTCGNEEDTTAICPHSLENENITVPPARSVSLPEGTPEIIATNRPNEGRSDEADRNRIEKEAKGRNDNVVLQPHQVLLPDLSHEEAKSRNENVVLQPHQVLLPDEGYRDRNKNEEAPSNDVVPKESPLSLDKEDSFEFPAEEKITRDQDMFDVLLQCLNIPYYFNVPFGQYYTIEPVDFNTIKGQFVLEFFSNRKFNNTYYITDISWIKNPYLLAQYTLKKNTGVLKERYLFHGTELPEALDIARNNFDWRKARIGKFGLGMCFANNPWYASFYSKQRHTDRSDYTMILAQVLVEQGELCLGTRDTRLPPRGHTTTNPSKEVLVKYDDGTCYPAFIVRFRER